jgi:sarcosine oxidase
VELKAEVVVIGAGIMGLATARALAREGADVVVLEQFRLGHKRGSSHGAARIFRLSYEDPQFVRLAQRALPLWRELEREASETLLSPTGCVDIGAAVRRRRRVFEECGVESELLDAEELEHRYPIAPGRYAEALFQRDAGVLHADQAHQAFWRAAEANGARLFEETTAGRIESGEAEVRVHTAADVVTANAVAVTAGAWAGRLLEPLGVRLPLLPTRETVVYFPLDGAEPFPAVIDWSEPPSPPEGPLRSTYSLPSPDGLLKAGIHRAGPATDPDDEGTVDGGTVHRIADWVRRHHPSVDPTPVASETCIYTNMPDESFALERQGRVVVGSACSGHGFKFAPVVGETLAAFALEAARSR